MGLKLKKKQFLGKIRGTYIFSIYYKVYKFHLIIPWKPFAESKKVTIYITLYPRSAEFIWKLYLYVVICSIACEI